MTREPGSITRPDPFAFFLTWTTYGSWLPGDARGWTDSRGGLRAPSQPLRASLAHRLRVAEVVLTASDRRCVEVSIAEVCRIRTWHLHAVTCRLQHVHAVVTAPHHAPPQVMQQLKGWASRSLDSQRISMHHPPSRRRWWTRGGSTRLVREGADLDTVIRYVRECQDSGRYE
ncbi:MAG: transposase [Planctomycetes bacterium]|nr:transposase [Planctomycetota bacterium]